MQQEAARTSKEVAKDPRQVKNRQWQRHSDTGNDAITVTVEKKQHDHIMTIELRAQIDIEVGKRIC